MDAIWQIVLALGLWVSGLAALFFGALTFRLLFGSRDAYERNRRYLTDPRYRHLLEKRGLAIDTRTNTWVETATLSDRQVAEALWRPRDR